MTASEIGPAVDIVDDTIAEDGRTIEERPKLLNWLRM